jgi:sarcosine oxidase delta subunit
MRADVSARQSHRRRHDGEDLSCDDRHRRIGDLTSIACAGRYTPRGLDLDCPWCGNIAMPPQCGVGIMADSARRNEPHQVRATTYLVVRVFMQRVQRNVSVEIWRGVSACAQAGVTRMGEDRVAGFVEAGGSRLR